MRTVPLPPVGLAMYSGCASTGSPVEGSAVLKSCLKFGPPTMEGSSPGWLLYQFVRDSSAPCVIAPFGLTRLAFSVETPCQPLQPTHAAASTTAATPPRRIDPEKRPFDIKLLQQFASSIRRRTALNSPTL